MSIREQETACKRAAKSLERARKELVEAEKREKAAIREHETARRNVILALFDLGAALFGLSAIAKDWKARAKALAGGETQYRRPIDVYFFFDKKRERAAAYASSENDLLKEIATDKSTRAGHYPWARKGKLGKRAPGNALRPISARNRMVWRGMKKPPLPPSPSRERCIAARPRAILFVSGIAMNMPRSRRFSRSIVMTIPKATQSRCRGPNLRARTPSRMSPTGMAT